MQSELQRLQATQPRSGEQKGWAAWNEEPRQVILKHRDLGHDWGFNQADADLLDRYLQANRTLVKCIVEARTLTKETAERLKDEIVQPAPAPPTATRL
ncbi:MAG: hypothetical protein K2Q23_14405 [Bryobacteraceae bacterium]|nr:hypothetical protein [Bryobacteraceae bacterium]